MTRLLLALMLLLPVPALADIIIDNCDDVSHEGEVIYAGEVVPFRLEAGKHRFFSGLPKAIRIGKDRSFELRPGDEWCIWGKDDVHLQRRQRTHGRTR